MTRTQMTELVTTRATLLERVKRYGMYWNTIDVVPFTSRTHAVHTAFRSITEALKEYRQVDKTILEMPVGGFTPLKLRQVHGLMKRINTRLDCAWIWMATDPVQGVSCFDEAWDAEYEEPRDIDARDTHLYEG